MRNLARKIDELTRWGLRNDPHGLTVAIAFPAFITLAAFVGAIL